MTFIKILLLEGSDLSLCPLNYICVHGGTERLKGTCGLLYRPSLLICKNDPVPKVESISTRHKWRLILFESKSKRLPIRNTRLLQAIHRQNSRIIPVLRKTPRALTAAHVSAARLILATCRASKEQRSRSGYLRASLLTLQD